MPQSQTNRSPSQTPRGRENRQNQNNRTKSTKISPLLLKRGSRNAKRTEKHKTIAQRNTALTKYLFFFFFTGEGFFCLLNS